MKIIPLSRFRRNLNSILKLLQSNRNLVIMVTRNKQEVFVLVSTRQYEELYEQTNVLLSEQS